MSQVRFLCLTNNAVQLQSLLEHLALVDPNVGHRFHALWGAASASAGYNALARMHGDADPNEILCFIHQDARLHFDWRIVPGYFDRLKDPGVLGFVGCKRLTEDGRWFQGKGHYGKLIQFRHPQSEVERKPNMVFGACTQIYTDGDYGFPVEQVQALDGFCLFIQRKLFSRVGGFADYLKGWHFYDIDLCLRAERWGMRNYVIDELAQHFSGGNDQTPEFREQQKCFRKNWRSTLAQNKGVQ